MLTKKMKKLFDSGDLVVHCPTEKHATAFLTWLDSLGYKWLNGNSLTQVDYEHEWSHYCTWGGNVCKRHESDTTWRRVITLKLPAEKKNKKLEKFRKIYFKLGELLPQAIETGALAEYLDEESIDEAIEDWENSIEEIEGRIKKIKMTKEKENERSFK